VVKKVVVNFAKIATQCMTIRTIRTVFVFLFYY